MAIAMLMVMAKAVAMIMVMLMEIAMIMVMVMIEMAIVIAMLMFLSIAIAMAMTIVMIMVELSLYRTYLNQSPNSSLVRSIFTDLGNFSVWVCTQLSRCPFRVCRSLFLHSVVVGYYTAYHVSWCLFSFHTF